MTYNKNEFLDYIVKSDLKKVIGAKEFRSRVSIKIKTIDENIKDDDLYFCQTRNGYSLAYFPYYPENNNADFIVFQNLDGTIEMNGNLYALIPTIRKFKDICDFENNI